MMPSQTKLGAPSGHPPRKDLFSLGVSVFGLCLLALFVLAILARAQQTVQCNLTANQDLTVPLGGLICIPQPTNTFMASFSATVQLVSVTIVPLTSTLLEGNAQQFIATVGNTANQTVTWTSTGGTVTASGLFTAGATAGAASVTATSVQDSTKSATAQITITAAPLPPPGGFDGPAALPRVYIDKSMAAWPALGAKTIVPAGANLQTAINNAHCGDTLLLAPGATFSVGIITTPNKNCDDQHNIDIRSGAPDAVLPPEGSRMLPCYAGVASLPGRPPFTCPNGVTNVAAKIVYTPGSGLGPFQFANGASNYRLGPGLEITRSPSTGGNYQMIGPANNAHADAVFVDRVWLHGTAQDDSCLGMQLSGVLRGGIFDSYVDDFHSPSSGTCTDPKGVAGGLGGFNGGPHIIDNNFIEASGENILYGGGGATVTPTDIQITRNHLYKNPCWQRGSTCFVGSPTGIPFSVKNDIEGKNWKRVKITGNILEYSWGGFSQAGWAFLLTPKNQNGNCPICETTDVAFFLNTISHVGGGIALADVPADNGAIGLAGERYSIHDITIDDVSAAKYQGSGYLLEVMSAWPQNPLNTILINHITGFPDPAWGFIQTGNATTNPPMFGFVLQNSIIGQNRYPLWSTGGTTNCAASVVPVTVLTTCYPQGYTFTNNALIAVNQTNYPPSKWPAGQFFPPDIPTVQFVNYANGNYALMPGSLYANAGTDGKNLGVDAVALKAAVAGVN